MELNIEIFADGADLETMKRLNDDPLIKGLTTNPTLMRKAGITDYSEFCKSVLKFVTEKPISFEVFADDFTEISEQAKVISSWGDNVFVKVPVMNTKGETCYETVEKLSAAGVKINATAVFTKEQIDNLILALNPNVMSNISIFAGRIADAGFDPLHYVSYGVEKRKVLPNCKIIWASPRQAYNIIEANNVGCDIITVTDDLIKKMSKFGYDLENFSLDTVKMFFDDATRAGYKI